MDAESYDGLTDGQVVDAVRLLLGVDVLDPWAFFLQHAHCMQRFGPEFRVFVVHPDHAAFPVGYVGAVSTDPAMACMRAWLKVNRPS